MASQLEALLEREEARLQDCRDALADLQQRVSTSPRRQAARYQQDITELTSELRSQELRCQLLRSSVTKLQELLAAVPPGHPNRARLEKRVRRILNGKDPFLSDSDSD